MGKRLRKTEKLDLIISELAKLRGEVRKLVRDRTEGADQGAKSKLRATHGPPKTLRKPTGKEPNRDAAPSKPALVQAPSVSQPTSQTAHR
jgi:hypothetical protein